MYKYLFLIMALLIFLFPSATFADKKNDSKEVKTDEGVDVDIHAIPPILDPEYRHRNKNQFEINPYAAAYLGNAIGQTWLAGAKAYFHFNNTFALGGNWGISRLLTNRDSAFGRTITDSLMQMANAEFMISNDAALRIGKSLIEMDFYMTLGIGGMHLNDRWQPMGLIGGGAKIYTGLPWLAFRIDINSYAHNVRQQGRDIVDFDVAILGGPSIVFPINPSPYEKK